ncbi:MAG: type IV pilus assembly protein PilM [Acidimicrobiales bacterium]
MAQRIVGLDIGTSAIRAVELTVNPGSPPTMETFGQVGLPVGTVVDGEIRDRSGVARAIRRLWSEGGFSEKKVNIGIAGLRAITREIDMPDLPLGELNEAVKFQADEVIPFPIEQTAISSKVIARYNNAEGNETLRVLVAAAHRDLVDSVVATAQEAGLNPVGVDLNTAALVRALHDPSFTGGPEAIVSVGAGLTLVVVHDAGVLQFVRTIDIAGESITKSLASALDLPLPDAEALKRRLGEPGPADTRALHAVEQSVDDLAGEIRNSIRFFSSLPGRSPVARVLVTGAAARTVGFLAKLQSELEIPIQPASPLSMVDISRLSLAPEEAAAINPTLAVPVGLALPDPEGQAFNLIPPEIARAVEEKRIRQLLILAAAVVIVVLVVLSVLKVLDVNSAKSQVTTIANQNSYIQNVEIPKYNKAVQLQNQVKAEEANFAPTVANEVDWLVVFNQLGQYTTPNATMASLSLTSTPPTAASSATPATKPAPGPGGVPAPSDILGQVTASTITVPTYPDVTTWGISMANSPVLLNVLPTSALTNSNGTVTFSAAMEIGGDAHSQRLSLFNQVVP